MLQFAAVDCRQIDIHDQTAAEINFTGQLRGFNNTGNVINCC